MIFKDVGAGIWVFTIYIPDTRRRLRNKVGLDTYIAMYAFVYVHMYYRDAWALRFGFHGIEAPHFHFRFFCAKVQGSAEI